MRHRTARRIPTSRARKAGVGIAALALVLSGAAPGALAETSAAPQATGNLTWFAEDDGGSAVAETTYELAGPDAMERSVVDNDGQDSNTTTGTITLDELPVGEYTITQVGAPEGYEVGDEAQRVVVTEQGQEPGLPITFVNAVVAAEDEAGDEGADTGDAEEARGESGAAEEPEATEPEPTEEAEQPAAEEEATQQDATEETEQPAAEEEATEEEPAAEISVSDEAEVEVDVSASPAAIPPGQPGTNRAHILVKKGGDRVGSSTTVTPLTGATFEFYRVSSGNILTGGTHVGTCTTDAGDNGICGVDVELPSNSNYFYVVETGAPSGWTAPLTWGSSTQYVRYNTGNIQRSATNRVVTLPGTGRTFPDVRDNPEVPARCGLNIAVVFDLSGSVRPYLPQYKAAGKGFVDALAGTPSSIALYTFGTDAPRSGAGNGNEPLTSVATSAGANALKDRIDGFSSPTAGQYTNWDLGLAQVQQGNYDAVLFLTDGDPTVYRNGTSGSTGLREVEEGIHSANKVKAETSLIVVGIGDGVSGTASQKRLSLLSSDYHTESFELVGELLRELALENCLGTLTVVKQERAVDGTLSPGVDWTFTTTSDDVTPTSGQTDANGAVNFEVGGYSDTITTRDITVAETQQPGFQLEQQSGFNAVCTNTATGLPVTSSNSGGLGFTVPVPYDGAISCQVINKVHPTITLQKSWVDGLTGDSATLTINGQPTDPAVVSTVGGTPTFVDTTNVVTVGAVPGSTVTLAETLAGTGTYGTDLSCVQGNDPVDITYTDGALTGSLTMPTDSVVCTFTNSRAPLEDLSVSKTASTSYDRTYTWSIEKVADSDRIEIADGGTATAQYDVTVTAEDRIDSNITISGQITVTNDNPVAFTGVDVIDVLPGATCTVTGGTDVTVPANSTATLGYSCTGSVDNIDEVGNTNTATATWDPQAYPNTSGEMDGTAGVSFGDPANETNRVVTVNDAFAGAPAELLPLDGDPVTLDWMVVKAAEDSSHTFSYERPITGVAGTCTDYPNVATIVETEQHDNAEVTVCVGMDLDVEKNVVLSLDRSFDYALDKDVNETQLNVDPETGEATFIYTVTVTDGPSADSNWQMTGEITVTNPNEWPVDAVVTDTVDNGGVCTVTGGEGAQIPGATADGPGEETFPYICTFAQPPSYDGMNTATVTWDEEEYFSPSGSADYDVAFGVDDWDVEEINKTVTVIDDKTDPTNPVTIGSHTWTGLDNSQDYYYELTLEGTPGECVDYTNNAWLQQLPDVNDDQVVTVCWPLDLSVVKTVEADFDREYKWLLDKDVDRTSVVIGEDESATFNYTVSVTPDGIVDSNWAMSGNITVTNPNATAVTTTVTDVPDVGGGATCTVATPELTVPGGGSASTAYSCSFTSQPNYTGGTNTATINWTDVNGDPQSAADERDVAFDLDGETHRTVPVYDNQVDLPAPGQLLGVSDYYIGPFEYEYSLTFEGVAGECTDYTNTASIPELQLSDDQTVTVCVELGPEVSKTAEADYDREYFWDITKVADETEVTITEGGEVTFDYLITTIPSGFEDSGFTLGGTITVENPNAVGDMTVTVTDVPTVGGVCTVVDGVDVVLEPLEVVVLDYTCSFEEAPDYAGTNTATVVWETEGGESGTATAEAPINFVIDEETNLTVDVYDDEATGGEPTVWVGTSHYYDGPFEFEYALTFPGLAGTCTDYTNTAVIEQTGDEDDQTVTVCVETAPGAEKSAEASFDREYFWNIVKDVNATAVEIVGTEATFTYTVTTSPNGFEDSGWALAGEISVTNPNDFQELTVSVTDVADVGGECTVVDGEDVVIGAGATETFAYSCTFEEQPDYSGVNTAYVAWVDVAGEEQTETAEADVVFDLDGETNLTVDVHDDKVTLVAPGELLGTSHFYDGPYVFTYDLTLPGVAGECVTHTNTAVIPATGDDDTAEVTICVEDELVITKTAEADFDREYFWNLEKSVDQTEVTISEGGVAEFAYVVTAIADGFEDSGWAMSGQITVNNPNEYDEGTVTVEVTDTTDVGGTCEVIDGVDVVVAPGATEVFDYVCSFDEQPDYEGSNVATVTWTGPDGEIRTVETDPVEVVFELDEETNLTVDVHDDKVTGDAPGELLGIANWHDGDTEFPYTMEFPGQAGTCTDYTNTAVIPATGDGDDQTVTVCVELAPEVSKTAAADFDRTYDWLIEKSVDRTRVVLTEDGTAEFNYVVEAIPNEFADSGWELTGQISVTNPNDFQELTVSVTDVPSMGGTCTVVDGADAVLAPSETRVFDYTCTYDEQPDYAGSNTAHVAWADSAGEDQSTASDPVEVVFELDGETNRTVDVYDDMVTLESPGEYLGTADFYEGPFEFEYSLDLPGVVGSCVDYTNTAVILESITPTGFIAPQAVGDEDSETVTVCIETAPEVSKTAAASFDRTYDWDIDKDVDATSVEIVGTDATFHYTVTTSPAGFADSGWELTGQISVTNPNDFQELTVTVTDVADVGGTCTVVDGEDVVIDAGATEVFDYSCTFEEQPAYEGSNTAYVAWTNADGVDQTTASDPVDVAFDLDGETNLTVDVHDDKVTGVAPGELLGTSHFYDGPYVFEYDLTLPGVVGECVDHTNTAVIPATGDEAQATVTICVEDDLVITKTAQADFDREYFWKLTKEVDRTKAIVEDGALAQFNYVVSATPDGFADSGWAMAGQITVTNPNQYDEGTVTVEVTDITDVGGTCEVVDGVDVVLAPGVTEVFDYVCSFEEQPGYEGSNLATVTWTGPDGEERSSTTIPVDVSFELDEETNREVNVYDDKVTLEAPGELLGVAVWNAEGTPTEFTYSLSFGGVVGEWTYYENTASIDETGDEASQVVRVKEKTPTPPVPPKPPVIPTGDPVSDGTQWALVVAGVTAMMLALLGALAAIRKRREQ